MRLNGKNEGRKHHICRMLFESFSYTPTKKNQMPVMGSRNIRLWSRTSRTNEGQPCKSGRWTV